MSNYVEFTGKTLDEAIKEACSFFAVNREKLEIEIVNDAKTGIFGLVGAKKATIKARRARLEKLDLGRQGEEDAPQRGARGGNARPGRRNPKAPEGREPSESSDAAPKEQAENTLPAVPQPGELEPYKAAALPARAEDAPETEKNRSSRARGQRGRSGKGEPGQEGGQNQRRPENAEGQGQRRGRPDGRPDGRADGRPDGRDGGRPDARQDGRQDSRGEARGGKGGNKAEGRADPRRQGGRQRPQGSTDDTFTAQDADFQQDLTDEQLPHVSLADLPQEELRASVLEAMHALGEPIAGKFEAEYELGEGRVNLRLDCGENCGLLIGREGQTLSALQYLLSCIVSRRVGATVRVQIDAGDYRGKQDEKLRELAQILADKVRASQKPQSTRPLSAYHRRIIHLALHDDPDVQTHSKGEGGLKRVVVVPRRKKAAS